MATKKKTTRTKRLPKFVAADYMLREHPFIIKLERMFRRMISNANDTRSKTLTNKDLTAYENFLNKSTEAEKRETKKISKMVQEDHYLSAKWFVERRQEKSERDCTAKRKAMQRIIGLAELR